MSNNNPSGNYRQASGDDRTVARPGTFPTNLDPKTVEFLQAMQMQMAAANCAASGNYDSYNTLGISRFINPVYWIMKVVDHGRRQHCIRLGPNSYGTFCVGKSNAPPYSMEEAYRRGWLGVGIPSPQLAVNWR